MSLCNHLLLVSRDITLSAIAGHCQVTLFDNIAIALADAVEHTRYHVWTLEPCTEFCVQDVADMLVVDNRHVSCTCVCTDVICLNPAVDDQNPPP